MSSRPRRPKTDESGTPENPSRPSRPLPSRSEAADETKSKSKEKTTSTTERPSNLEPRRSTQRVPAGTETYDPTSVRPLHFSHIPSQPGTAERSEPTPKPRISELLGNFLTYQLEDYKACERYCINTPAIWSQNVQKLRELVVIYIHEGKADLARRCAERYLMITIAQGRQLSAADANTFVRSLRQNDQVFRDTLDGLIGQLSTEDVGTETVASPPGRYSLQSSDTSSNPMQPPRRGSTAEHTTRFPSSTQGERPPAQTSPRYERHDFHGTDLPYRTTRTTSQTQGAYTRRPQADMGEAVAPEAEEASEIHVGTETVDDNITLGEQERRETGIDDRTQGIGPNLSLISSNYEEKDHLHDSYKVRTGRDAVEFFVRGRVFAMVWHENAGTSANPNMTETTAPLDKPFNRYTINADGVTIFSHIRRFVIIKAKKTRRYCLAIPINSYRGRGLTDKRMLNDEKQAHTIIYDSNSQPKRMSGEVKLHKEPIAVVLVPGETLTPSSRLHFGKMQSIDWNVKVKDIGRITDPRHVRRLTAYFNREFSQDFKRGDDTATEAEG